jgi:hypothetical protein
MWILGGALLLLLIILISFSFLTSDGESGDSSTTLSAGAASTIAEIATTAADTTTTAAATTTTGGATTTTIVEATSSAVATGNWADEPLVVAGFGALGWWDGSSWVKVETGDSLPVNGGEDYQVAVLDLTATTTGGPQAVVCGPLDNIGVVLSHEELLGAWPGPYGVAISAPWVLTPHIVEQIEDDGTYAVFARELLSSRGLDVANPVIKQLLRVDLEGDGVNEVLVVAEEVTGGFFPTVGDYSIIFMRKSIEGTVETALLESAIVFDPDVDFSAAFTVGAVSDLSGDGKMEVVVSAAYFEGLGVKVFEYVNDDLGPVSQLSTGCGA